LQLKNIHLKHSKKLNYSCNRCSAHSEHVQVIGCDIKLELVEKCRDVEEGPISRKKHRVVLGLIFKTPLYFCENENSTSKA
jgi:hypothetical protein